METDSQRIDDGILAMEEKSNRYGRELIKVPQGRHKYVFQYGVHYASTPRIYVLPIISENYEPAIRCATTSVGLDDFELIINNSSTPTAPIVIQWESHIDLMERKYNIADIPIGKCCQCGIAQRSPGEGGFWINGRPGKWACTGCKYGHPIYDKEKGTVTCTTPEIRSYPTACEWCTFIDVKWFQGQCYDCPRCNALGLAHR